MRGLHLRNEHYLNYIKGQNDTTLTIHILKLLKENRLFVRKLESKQLGEIQPLSKTDLETIRRYRWYLEDTLLALENLGIDFSHNNEEQNAYVFQDKIPSITRLGFYIGGYLRGIEKYDVEINEDKAVMSYSLSDTNSIPPIILMEPDHLYKDDFYRFIHSIYMGEWREEYLNKKDYTIFENTIWAVEIFYADGSEKITFNGFNAFPYNFKQFLNFFESHKRKVYTI